MQDAVTLAKAVAGANSAIKAKGAVDVSPLRARCVREDVDGAEGRCEGDGCRLFHRGVAGPRGPLWVGLQ